MEAFENLLFGRYFTKPPNCLFPQVHVVRTLPLALGLEVIVMLYYLSGLGR